MLSKVLVIGGTGYLGKLLKLKLQANNIAVITASNSSNADNVIDAKNPIGLTSLIDKLNVDLVLNLASHGLGDNIVEAELLVNSKGPSLILESINNSKNSDCRLVHFASTLEWPFENFFESKYAESKWVGTKSLILDNKLNYKNSSVIFMNNIYGVSQPINRLFRGVIEKIRNKQEIVLNFPNRLRDFCLDDEVSENIFSLLVNDEYNNKIFTIGTGISTSVINFVEEIFSQMGANKTLLKANVAAGQDNFEKLPSLHKNHKLINCEIGYKVGIGRALSKL
jgi:nucleoside-diphosphate-sugar epimerase